MFDVPYDLSACIENMLLEAHSLGLGAVWVHGPAVYPRMVKKLKELLKIPAGEIHTRFPPMRTPGNVSLRGKNSSG